MATHDYVIANQGFPAFRADLNDALAAIVTNNSSATAPATTFAHMLWVDTAANPSILKMRNADNDAWITIGTIDQTGDTFTLTSAVSATTLNTSGQVVFNDAGDDVDFRVEGDTNANLLFVDASADSVGIGNNQPTIVDGNTNTKLTVGDTTTNNGALGVVTTARKRTSGNGSVGAFQFANTDIAGTEKRIAIIGGSTGTATNDGVIEFFTASSGTLGEVARFTQDKYLRFASATGGIQFGGDTAAANALDDYEEGTFTPSIFAGISSPVYSTAQGAYTKIGRLVSFRLRIALSSGTANGDMVEISDLPFTVGNITGNYGAAVFAYASSQVINSTSTNLPTLYLATNTTRMQFYRTSGSNFLGTDFSTAGTIDIYLYGSYFTA